MADVVAWDFMHAGVPVTLADGLSDGVQSIGAGIGNSTTFPGSDGHIALDVTTDGTSHDAAEGNAQYLEFTVTVDADHVLDLSGFTLDVRQSGAHDRGWALRSSLDGFAADLGAINSEATAFTQRTVDLSGAAFQGLTDTSITFRLLTWRSGSGGSLQIIAPTALQGTVTATATPVTGSGAATTAGAASSGTAAMAVDGTAAATVGGITASGAAGVGMTAHGAAALSGVAASADGEALSDNTAALRLGGLGVSGNAGLTVRGVGSTPATIVLRLDALAEPGATFLARVGATFARASTATLVAADGTIQSVAADVLRRSYVADASGGLVPTYLVESARTNLLKQSTAVSPDTTVWGNNGPLTVTPAAASIFAGATAYEQRNIGAGSAARHQTVGALTAAKYCLAVILETVDAVASEMLLYDLSVGIMLARWHLDWSTLEITRITGVDTEAGALRLENGRVLFWLTALPTTPAHDHRCYIYPASTAPTTTAAIIHGADFSLGAFPTSPILTTDTAATRAADTLTIPLPAGVVGQSVARYQRYWDLASQVWVEAVDTFTAGATLTLATDRAYRDVLISSDPSTTLAQFQQMLGAAMTLAAPAAAAAGTMRLAGTAALHADAPAATAAATLRLTAVGAAVVAGLRTSGTGLLRLLGAAAATLGRLTTHVAGHIALPLRATAQRTRILLRRRFTLTDARLHALTLLRRRTTLLLERPMTMTRLPAWDPKRSAEIASYALDLQLWLASGETLTGTPTATITVASDSGTTEGDVTLVAEEVAIDGTRVVVSLSGGRHGVKYVVAFAVTTTAGQTLAPAATIVVEDLAL